MLSPIRGWMKTGWMINSGTGSSGWSNTSYLWPNSQSLRYRLLHGGVRMLRNRYLMMNVIVTTLVIRTWPKNWTMWWRWIWRIVIWTAKTGSSTPWPAYWCMIKTSWDISCVENVSVWTSLLFCRNCVIMISFQISAIICLKGIVKN